MKNKYIAVHTLSYFSFLQTSNLVRLLAFLQIESNQKESNPIQSPFDGVLTNNLIKGHSFLFGQGLRCYLHQRIKRARRNLHLNRLWKI